MVRHCPSCKNPAQRKDASCSTLECVAFRPSRRGANKKSSRRAPPFENQPPILVHSGPATHRSILSPSVAKQRKLMRMRCKAPPIDRMSPKPQGALQPTASSGSNDCCLTDNTLAPLLQPEKGLLAPRLVGVQVKHLLLPEMRTKSGQLLFQNSFPETFEGRLRQSLSDCYAPMSVAVGEGKTLQMLSSIVGYLAYFPPRLLERNAFSQAKPSVELVHAALLRMAWNFVRNGDENSPHELRKMMRFPCSKQEQQEIHALEIAIIGWGSSN